MRHFASGWPSRRWRSRRCPCRDGSTTLISGSRTICARAALLAPGGAAAPLGYLESHVGEALDPARVCCGKSSSSTITRAGALGYTVDTFRIPEQGVPITLAAY